jgi:uncharacterized protein YcaQ
MTGDYRRPAMLRLSATAARRLAIRAQRLGGPAPRRRPDREAILETCRTLRCLQLDPTNVVARNHLLVLFSRLGPFDPALLEQLTYADRELFEYWAHEASLVLSEDLPLHRWAMQTWHRGAGVWQRRARAWWDLNEAFRAYIVDRLRADGPLPLREIEDRSVAPWLSTGWTHQRNVSRMLDLMWVRGQVGIGGRAGGQRLWDLMERCLPPGASQAVPDEREVTRQAALFALKALGVARAPHIRAHFTRGRYPGLPEALAELHERRAIVPVAVDGLGDDWWMRAEDAEANGDWRGRTALLSPFDNLLCDRARTERLFGFSHRLEIYTPKAKRRWGYFVLPILHDDRLIGRADLAIDRERGRLVAHTIHREPDAPRGKAVARAITRELERLAKWQGTDDLELREVPVAWPLG